MSTNDQKKPLNWIKLAQFIIFSISCLAGVMIWFFAQQDKTSYEISQNYVSKFELQLIQKEVEIINLELRDFKTNFSAQIDKMEASNDSILELITDIRLIPADDQPPNDIPKSKQESNECIESIKRKQARIKEEIIKIKKIIKKNR